LLIYGLSSGRLEKNALDCVENSCTQRA